MQLALFDYPMTWLLIDEYGLPVWLSDLNDFDLEISYGAESLSDRYGNLIWSWERERRNWMWWV